MTIHHSRCVAKFTLAAGCHVALTTMGVGVGVGCPTRSRPWIGQAEVSVCVNQTLAFSGPLPLPNIAQDEHLAALEFGQDLDGLVRVPRWWRREVLACRSLFTRYTRPCARASLALCSCPPVSCRRQFSATW